MEIRYQLLLDEIKEVLDKSNFSEKDNFIRKILGSQHILVCGAGRVGLMMKSFAMRLNHLGLNCSFLGEVSVPSTGQGDLLIIGSGSGSTRSILALAEIAKSKGLELICITSAINSPISNLSKSKLVLNCPNKSSDPITIQSAQPMTTLFEQSLLILLDSLVLELMVQLNENNTSMLRRHNVVE
jgi:6-phospho-3-hexuloisomerase